VYEADLMTADRAEATRSGPQELLWRVRGPIGSMALLKKSGKKLQKC
jgi:hypothetical protein